MKIIPLIACIFIASCVQNNNKMAIVQGSGKVYYDWQEEQLEKCKMETAVLSIQIYEGKLQEGYTMNKQEFDKLNAILSSSCLRFYNLTI